MQETHQTVEVFKHNRGKTQVMPWLPTGYWLGDVPSLHSRWRSLLHRTPPKAAPLRSLAKQIARDETNVSTFECTLQDTLNEAYIMQYAYIGGMGRLYIVVHYPWRMKDSSWLINISISLLKKILQKQYSFSRRYHISARFHKDCFKERKFFFFAKFLVEPLPAFHHPYLPGT